MSQETNWPYDIKREPSVHSADTEPSKIDPPLPPKKFSNGDDHSTILSILAEKLAPTMTYIGPYWGLKTGPFL